MKRKKKFHVRQESAFQRKQEYELESKKKGWGEQKGHRVIFDAEDVAYEAGAASQSQEGKFISVEMIDADRAAEDDMATPEDIAKRLRYQDERFVELLSAGEVTPQWKAYAEKRPLEINEAMGRRKEIR